MDTLSSGIYQDEVKVTYPFKTISSKVKQSLKNKRFHFIGVGGVGMSGLAKILIKDEAIISGSDQIAGGVTDKLSEMGADIKIGHKADNVGENLDAVVISAAVKEDNPELMRAREQGSKVYKYAEMLGQLMNQYDGVAVSGTHGKSTTSGWLAFCLKEAGMDPNFIIGAEIAQYQTSSGVGESKNFVVEACEYDRSFLNLKPKIGCILNIEADHLDYYKDEEEIVEAFRQFSLNIRRRGMLIANGEDANVVNKIVSRLPSWLQCETFGFAEHCDYYAKELELNDDGMYSFNVYYQRKLLGRAKISVPGKHNVANALAVIAMAMNLGMPAEKILSVLPNFTGMDRRLMLKGKVSDITIIDDYAHHPTEIQASLKALRQRYQPKRMFCIFQPHQYSRTRFLLDDFAESFKLADITIVPQIYFVRDTQEGKKQVNAEILVEKINTNGSKAEFIDGFGQICEYLKRNVNAGDLVVTMGAGDIWKVADEYIQWLRERC